MATPFSHTHVLHVAKTGRRRSRSVTTLNSDQEDGPEQIMRRKQFWAQLQMDREKQQNNRDKQHEEQQDEEDYQPVVTRVPGAHNTHSTKKHTLSTTAVSVPLKKQISSTTCKTLASDEDEQHEPAVTRIKRAAPTMPVKQHTSFTTRKNSDSEDDEQYQPVVSRVKRSSTTMSGKKQTSSTSAISTTMKKEILPTTSNTKSSQENEQYHGHQSVVIRIPRSESTMSLKKQNSTKTYESSNVNIFTTYKNSNYESSQISSNPFQSSSTNLMSKSQIFDQEFYLDDNKDHKRRNDAKRRGKINISGQGKSYNNYDRKLYARSSASCMAALIAIVIAIIAFAFGLTSLVLVLLLRSTVATKLGTNSTTSNSLSSSSSISSSATWLATACSIYITIDDPTRNVYASGYALGCDNTAPFMNQTFPVWIRFIGTGGTTLPLVTPGLHLCGSEGTGWYDGVMPSSGEIANGTACFTWYTSVCRYSQSISVANCGSFYTYLLPPAPACMMRYCTV